MSQSSQQEVNIGTVENPVMVPAVALENSTESDEWWMAIASGSIILDNAVLRTLLRYIDDNKDSENLLPR